MIQLFRIPQSGASTCHAFSGIYFGGSYICARCLQNRRFITNSSDSSALMPAVNKKVKSRRRGTGRKLKETELLKVTKTQTTQTTMTIGKLNASDVAAFVEEPGMILKNIKKAKSIGISKSPDSFSSGTLGKFEKKFPDNKTNNNKNLKDFNSPLRNMENILNVNVNKYEENKINLIGQSNEISEEENVIIQKSSSQILSQEKEKVDLFEENYYTRSVIDEIEWEKSLDESIVQAGTEASHMNDPYFQGKEYFHEDSALSAYVDVCVHCGLIDHAYQLLNRKSTRKIKNPEVFETLLRSFSNTGDLIRADYLVKKMKKFNIPLTPQTVALHLLCVAQGEVSDGVEKTALILENFKENGFKINDLFTKTKLKIEEKEIVLKQIRKIEPYFDIAPSIVNLNSNCPLVANLYKDQQPITSPAPFIDKGFILKAVEEQLALEHEQTCNIKKIGDNHNFSEKHRLIWSNLKKKWGRNFLKNFDSSLAVLETEFNGKTSKHHIYPYLLTSSNEALMKLAMEEVDELVQFSPGYSEGTYILYERLGRKVYQMYCKKRKTADEEFNQKMKRQIEIFCRWYVNPVGPARNARQKWQLLMGDNPDMTFMLNESLLWPRPVMVNIGKFLYNIIFKSAVINGHLTKSSVDVPAFYFVLRQKMDGVVEQVKIHPVIGNLLKKANNDKLKFPAYQLPMLCPPKPWSSTECGGYYFLSTDLIRSNFNNSNKHYLKTVPNENLYAIFDSLNKLQSVPWRINKKVLDVAIDVFNKGGSKELDIPVKPDQTPLGKIPKNLDIKSKLEAYKERNAILSQRHDQYCLWCEGLYKLSLANHFRDKIFWLPQNMDFRGRVYPVPPHVSHVSADLYRSLLLFAKKERLGENGFDWLKIHVINLTGAHKKKNIRERLEYANQILPDIVDSAENPLNGKRWWTESDDPWQTLAACFEINEVLKCEDPKMYETGFPIHQDGSCNGLQHYAALGRDTHGAISVNLSPSDVPQDVYADVARLIEEERMKDEEAGVNIAKVLNGFVTRKVVKRPVMTTVYGVTLYGAKLQISGVLSDIPEFPKDQIPSASLYLAVKIFQSLRKLFTSAREIQDWFNACSDVITRHCNESICWENPLGLPIIQPYFKLNKNKVMTPNPWKQKNAFAPNFIHSLDSSHMMLTALNCDPAGLTFAAIHDCFWTHPSSVDKLNKICRQSFVCIHSLNILESLSNHFIRKYLNTENREKCEIFSKIPNVGNFDLKSVNDSVYFFA